MGTIFRDWGYRYQWFYDAITRLAALSVGGEQRFRQLPLQDISIQPDTNVLDLCCGCGQATGLLVQHSRQVTGLDASPLALQRARWNVPEATYVEAWAEQMPFADETFDVIHTSAALHEMQPEQLQQILKELFRVLKPGGWFVMADFHAPTNPLFWPAITLFFWLFETETAWQLLETNLPELLQQVGFRSCQQRLYAGGSLQIIRAEK
jgi:demethylmenaquinone methyltransferase/2-methoxy-6-polyprenyl-1,4-benzoquinol methylase